MANRTKALSVHGYPSHLPTAGLLMDEEASVRSASLVGGVGLLLLSALAVFGVFVAVEGLVTHGDARQTAQDIMASQGLFRLGIVSLFLVVALDVVVAWALYRVFSPVNDAISVLAGWLRLVYAGIFMVAISQLAGALRLLGEGSSLGVFSADQLEAQALFRIQAFTDVYDAGLVLFGLHLIVIGYLAYRSTYVPKVLGVLLGIAGIGYMFDSFAAALGVPTNVGAFTFLGEFLLALWLVIQGRRIAGGPSGPQEDPIAVGR